MQDRSSSGPSNLRRLLLLVASLGVGAVGWYMLGGERESAVAAEKAAAEKTDRKALARVNGVAISEEEIFAAAAADLMKLDRQRHEVLSNFVAAEVRDRLLAMAAEERGVSTEDYVASEVDGKLSEVPQAEVDELYEANKARIRQPKENVEQQIREYLAREAMHRRLREAAEVEILLEPFRVEVAATGPAKGGTGAPVTIVEFSDFECPYWVNPALAKVAKKYGDKVRIVFRQFPLDFHPNARKAGEASLCAGAQSPDFFWQLHDAMFADQKNLGVASLKEKAAAIAGLDSAAFDACLDSGRFAAKVDEDMAAGVQAGVGGTPAFFINGRFVSGVQPYEAFAEIIDDELERAEGSG